MSKLSGTITSTPEEKWGLLDDTVDAEAIEPDTSAVVATSVATSSDAPEEPTAAKASAAAVALEKSSAEKNQMVEEDLADDPVGPEDSGVDGGAEDGGAKSGGAKGGRTDDTSEPKPAKGRWRKGRSDGTPANKAEATSDSGDGRRSWRAVFTIRRVAVGALVVVAIAAIVVATILGLKLNEQNNIDTAADEARAAAEQYAVTLTSVSSDNLDQNFAAVLDGATGEFKDMYSQSSGQLRDLLVENQANAQGTVIDSGIKSATTSKVEVMLFVDQSVTNTATPDARIDRSRVLMTMEKIDGRWLASKVDLP
ncbi:MAG TPA: hypothetical protein VIQ49_08155 [Williamsia sp.]